MASIQLNGRSIALLILAIILLLLPVFHRCICVTLFPSRWKANKPKKKMIDALQNLRNLISIPLDRANNVLADLKSDQRSIAVELIGAIAALERAIECIDIAILRVQNNERLEAKIASAMSLVRSPNLANQGRQDLELLLKECGVILANPYISDEQRSLLSNGEAKVKDLLRKYASDGAIESTGISAEAQA